MNVKFISIKESLREIAKSESFLKLYPNAWPGVIAGHKALITAHKNHVQRWGKVQS